METLVINRTTPAELRELFIPLIRDFLKDLTCNYPHFEEWLEYVFIGSETSERSIIVCESCNRILGLAILKDSVVEKKICTLRVAPEFRHQGIGTNLISEARKILHEEFPLLTVSDEHIEPFRHFLSRFGFRQKSQVKSVYHYGHDEYYFNQPYKRENVLLSIKPEYSEKILNGEKTVEFRKKCFGKGIKRVYIYASTPIRKVIGYFEVADIVAGTPKELWLKYNKQGGIDARQYKSYFDDKTKGYAILIKKAVRLRTEIGLEDLMGKGYLAPQNYNNLDNVDTLRRLRLLE